MKLLYVEGNPFDRDLTRHALLKQIPNLGWASAESVQEALVKLVGEQRYDVLLHDMWLLRRRPWEWAPLITSSRSMGT
ncbi:MAG: hypothetical protein R6W97_01380 [Thiobacillus sp.]